MEEENQQLADTTKNSSETVQPVTPASGEVSTSQITEDPPILETPKEEEGSEEMTPQEDLSPTDPIRDVDVDGNGIEVQQGEAGNNIGRWTAQEHSLFLKGLDLYGKDWRKISTIVPTRTLIQIRTHAQKYFQKNDFGMKYDRIPENQDQQAERRRSITKRKVNRTHSRTTYQSTSRVATRPSHVIITRSRTPSPIPEDSPKMSANPPDTVAAVTIPLEYQPDTNETPDSSLTSFPAHYRSSVRASAMCRSSEDFFSRRITPLGIYEPKDRLKQEYQFASVVLELLKRKAFDDTNETVDETVMKTPSQPERKASVADQIKPPPAQQPERKASIADQIKPPSAQPERKASVADQIKPPPAHVRPTLRLTNPDRLTLFTESCEDDRENRNAPRTPANVRGNRSLLHKAILTSEKATRDFFTEHSTNGNAIRYYVNQADPHGFTPLMTAVCLSDMVTAMNLTVMLVEKGAELETQDRDGNTALMWAVIVGNNPITQYLLTQHASITTQNHDGNTPLHLAVIHSHPDCVEALAREQQDLILVQNNRHQIPLNILNSNECELSMDEKSKIREVFYTSIPSLRTLIVSHPDCLLHVPRENGSQGSNPWEAPARIDAIMSELKEELKDWEIDYDSSFEPASSEDILRAHSRRYLRLLCELNDSLEKDQSVAFTPHVQNGFGVPSDKIKDEAICDTSFSKGSLQAALRAAGGAIHAVDKVITGEYRNAFACIRPPGHHAGTDGLLTTASSCGFCVFNNVMIAALHALEKYPDIVRRIAIVDIDIHHGNGTEQILKRFNHPEKIMFWSSHIYFNDSHHDYEFYPGTGKADFVFNNIYNQPLQPLWETEHSRRRDGEGGRILFRKAVVDRLIPLLTAFKPDLIIVSSGFDGGHGDVGNYRHIPTVQVGMNLKVTDYTWALQKIQEVADYYCHGHLVSMLEGGYGSYEKRKSDGEIILGRSSLAHNVMGHMHGLLCEEEPEKPTTKRPSGSDGYCGCGEHRDEEMIECVSGKVCGGWVHFSCAGIDFQNFQEDDKDQFICKWCRAAGVSVDEKKDEALTSRLRSKVKPEKREPIEETEAPRKTRRRAKYSSYGSANQDNVLLDEDFRL